MGPDQGNLGRGTIAASRCHRLALAQGLRLPFLRLAGAGFSSFRRGRLLYRQCSGCHFQCSVIAGTAFEATKLPLTVWFLATHLLTKAKTDRSMLELSRHLGVYYPSAWLMKHKLMDGRGAGAPASRSTARKRCGRWRRQR